MRRQVFYRPAPGGEAPEELIVERRGSRCRIASGGSVEEVDMAPLPDGRFSLVFADGRQFSGRALPRGEEGVDVVSGGIARRVPLRRRRQEGSGRLARADPAGGVEEVRALMHGRIVEVCVAAGDRVEGGSLLLVLEAMKMQNEIRASQPGVVEQAGVAAGQTVEAGFLMLSIRSDKN